MSMPPASQPLQDPSPLRRWAPLLVLAALMGLAYALGLQHQLSLQALAEHQHWLQDFVAAHWLAAVGLYLVIYVAVVSLSLPGASLLSIIGGFVFGWMVSAPLSVVAATLGAIIVFKIVQTSLGAALARRAGPWFQKLARGFEADALNYLLFLRLVPAFPFFAVNAVAGLTRMPLSTFIIATLVGIIPGSFAFAFLGRGLGSLLDAARQAHEACLVATPDAACPYDIALSALVSPQLLWAFGALGLVALIPVALKKWKTP